MSEIYLLIAILVWPGTAHKPTVIEKGFPSVKACKQAGDLIESAVNNVMSFGYAKCVKKLTPEDLPHDPK